MNRNTAYALIVAGAILLIAGIRSSKSASSQLSEAFNNRPNQETTVLLVTGMAGLGAGAWMLLKKNTPK
jgi:hypothetical protein